VAEVIYLEPSEILFLVVGFFSSFLVCNFLVPRVMRKMNELKITGIDAHKLHKPEIPEMGGVAILVSVILSTALMIIPFEDNIIRLRLLAFLLTVTASGAVGIVDDLKRLGAYTKTLLTLIAALPLLIINFFYPILVTSPRFPFIGRTRLAVLYPFYAPVNVAVCSNTVNMLDIMNGVMPGTSAITFGAMLCCSVLLDSKTGLIISLVMLGIMIAYYRFNKYPAKVFSGDVGSLTVGAAIGALAIVGELEIVTVVALIPFIMNSFYMLTSMRKFQEYRLVKEPATVLLSDGRIAANEDPKAPIPLVRMMLARGPLTEPDIAKGLFLLSLVSAMLAILTAVLMVW
jgi:UDP-N-acetylglucosamine--dolichyl-phosphate N-acetylglucosaminephosphotransferase